MHSSLGSLPLELPSYSLQLHSALEVSLPPSFDEHPLWTLRSPIFRYIQDIPDVMLASRESFVGLPVHIASYLILSAGGTQQTVLDGLRFVC
jgi:hypothetical protein